MITVVASWRWILSTTARCPEGGATDSSSVGRKYLDALQRDADASSRSTPLEYVRGQSLRDLAVQMDFYRRLFRLLSKSNGGWI
jgi:hypothetical protein